MYAFTYKATGRGQFPIDMLRYDRSFPATETGSVLIEEDRSHRTVYLVHYSDIKVWEPSVRRWESFGWEAELTDVEKV